MGSRGIDMTAPRRPRTHGIIGIVCAILSTMFFAEAFGAAAIILGASQWKNDENSQFGLIVIIIGLLAMFLGIYFTAYPDVIDLIYP
jgi:membrane-bound ClpP family serine protease